MRSALIAAFTSTILTPSTASAADYILTITGTVSQADVSSTTYYGSESDAVQSFKVGDTFTYKALFNPTGANHFVEDYPENRYYTGTRVTPLGSPLSNIVEPDSSYNLRAQIYSNRDFLGGPFDVDYAAFTIEGGFNKETFYSISVSGGKAMSDVLNGSSLEQAIDFNAFGNEGASFALYDRGASGAYRLSNLTASSLPAVPEPATWAMMTAGFAAAGLALRRRRFARAHHA